MLAIGSTAPDFTLPDQHRQAFCLSDALRAGPLILYFYPADFTPGCTVEATCFRDMGKELADAGLRLAGISPQSTDSHERFHASLALNFPLLADRDKAVVRAYDADGPLGFGVRRVTYSIGSDGCIADALLADFRVARHEAFVREAIRLQERSDA